jgi:hypothetical protein
MKKTRFWLPMAAVLTGGACIVLGSTALAAKPAPEPPAGIQTNDDHGRVRPTPAPAPLTPDHFDNGPCWEDETAAGGDCPWMDNTEEAWSYRYNAYQDEYAGDDENAAEDDYYSEDDYCDYQETYASESVEESYGFEDEYDVEAWYCLDEECVVDHESGYDDYGYDDYGYDDYGYDNEEYMDETCPSEYADDAYEYYDDGMDDQNGSWEEDSEYEYDFYADQQTGPEADAAEDHGSCDYYDEESCGYGYDNGYDDSMYEGYSDAYPYEEYAYPEGNADDGYSQTYEYEHMLRGDYNYEVLYGNVTDEVDPCDASAGEEAMYDEEMYEYDAYDGVEENVDDRADAARAPAADQQLSGGLELFASQPAELLLFADQELLRTLQQIGGGQSRLRRVRFAEHLEALGWQAIDFAFRLEDVTGREVLGLSDDLPAAAAFLAAFRLVERGELGMDEGVASLRGTLDDITLDWIEGIDQITAEAYRTWDDRQLAGPAGEPSRMFDPTQLKNPVIEAVVSLATKRLGDLGGKILDLREKLAQIGWTPALAEPAQESSISQAAAPDPPLKR